MFEVERPDLDIHGLELSLARYNARYPILLVDLIPKREMRPLEIRGHILEVIFDDKVRIAELDPPAVLVARIRHLIVPVTFLGVEAEVLRQVKEEGGVVAGGRELSAPAVRGVATDDEAGVAVVLATHGPVLVVALHLQDDDVRLPHQVLLVLEGLQHSLDGVPALPNVSLGVNLYRLDSLLDNRVVRQVEVQYDFYMIYYYKCLHTLDVV